MILDTTIDILPNVNSHLLHNISLLLLKFVDVYKMETDSLSEFLFNAFDSKHKYS